MYCDAFLIYAILLFKYKTYTSDFDLLNQICKDYK